MLGRTTKRDVLKVIGSRTLERKSTSFLNLTDELLVSEDAACSHLKRLWRERLIKRTEYPSSYLDAGRELSIRDLDFRITRRGVERLDRWKEEDKRKGWFL
jgi:hypothetical protein